MPNDYRKVYLNRVKQGVARAPKGGSGTVTFDGPNIADETKPPKVPPKQSPQLPVDDAFKNYRTEQA